LLTADEPKEYTVKEKLKAGEHKLVVEYTNDVYKENELRPQFLLTRCYSKAGKIANRPIFNQAQFKAASGTRSAAFFD